MLLGTHEHTIDDKSRLTLPAKLRREFEEGVVLTRGIETCLLAYPRQAWERAFGSRLDELDPLRGEARRLQRYFFANMVDDALDRQGRIGIPAPLKEYAKIERDVVVAGVNDHLEIWDRDAWRRELAEVEGSAGDVAERLAAQRG